MELEEQRQVIAAKNDEIMRIQNEKRELQNKVKELTMSRAEFPVERRRALSAKPIGQKFVHNHFVTVSSTWIPSIEERVSLRVQILDLKQQIRDKDTEIQTLAQKNHCSRCFGKKKSFKILKASPSPELLSKSEQQMKLHDKVFLNARIKELEEELFQVYQDLDEANDVILQWLEFSQELEGDHPKVGKPLAVRASSSFFMPLDSDCLQKVRAPFLEEHEREIKRLEQQLQTKGKQLECKALELEQAYEDIRILQQMMLEMDEEFQTEWAEEFRYREELLSELLNLQLARGTKLLSPTSTRRSSITPSGHRNSISLKDKLLELLPELSFQGHSGDERSNSSSPNNHPTSKAAVTKPVIESPMRSRTQSVIGMESTDFGEKRNSGANLAKGASRRASLDVPTNGAQTAGNGFNQSQRSRRSSLVDHNRKPSLVEGDLYNSAIPSNSRKNSLVGIQTHSNRPSITITPSEPMGPIQQRIVSTDSRTTMDFINKSLDQLNQSVQMVKQEAAIHKMEQLLSATAAELESGYSKLQYAEEALEAKEKQLNLNSQLIDELMVKVNQQNEKLERMEDKLRQKDLELDRKSLELRQEKETIQNLQIEMSQLKNIMIADIRYEDKDNTDLFSMESILQKQLNDGSLSTTEYENRMQMLQDLKLKQDRLLIVSQKFKDQLHQMADQFGRRVELSSIRGIEQRFSIYSPTTMIDHGLSGEPLGNSEGAISIIVPLKKKLAKAIALNKELEMKLELARLAETRECSTCTEIKSLIGRIQCREILDMNEVMGSIHEFQQSWTANQAAMLQVKQEKAILSCRCSKLESKVSRLSAMNKKLAKKASRRVQNMSRNSLPGLAQLFGSTSSKSSEASRIDQGTLTTESSCSEEIEIQWRKREVFPLESRIQDLQIHLKQCEHEIETLKDSNQRQLLQMTELESKKVALEEETVKASELLNQYQVRENALLMEVAKNKENAFIALETNRGLEAMLQSKIAQLEEYDLAIKRLVESKQEQELLLSNRIGVECQLQTEMTVSDVSNLEREISDLTILVDKLRKEISAKVSALSESEDLQRSLVTERETWAVKYKELLDTLSNLKFDILAQKQAFEAKEASLVVKCSKTMETHSKLKKRIITVEKDRLEQKRKLANTLSFVQQWYTRLLGCPPPKGLLRMLTQIEKRILEADQILNRERKLNEDLQQKLQSLIDNQNELLMKCNPSAHDQPKESNTSKDCSHPSMIPEQALLEEMKGLHRCLLSLGEHPHKPHIEHSILQMTQELVTSQKHIVKDIIKRSEREMEVLSVANSSVLNPKHEHLGWREKYSQVRIQVHTIVLNMDHLFQSTLGKSVFAKSKAEEIER
jgi:hypothetical protein